MRYCSSCMDVLYFLDDTFGPVYCNKCHQTGKDAKAQVVKLQEEVERLRGRVKRLESVIKRHDESFSYDTSVGGWYALMKRVNERLYAVAEEDAP